jgi:hypothetical protein
VMDAVVELAQLPLGLATPTQCTARSAAAGCCNSETARSRRYRAAAFAPRARECPPTVALVRPSLDPFQCGRSEIYSASLDHGPSTRVSHR